MNNILKLSVLLVAALSLTACINDLNTKPIDKNSSTSFNQDRMFTKCYATLGLTGQKGPDGDGDVDDLDEGTSAMFRTIWYMNTITSDEGWWIWDDAGVPQLRVTEWNGDNELVRGIYARLVLDIRFCNHYITYASTDTEEDKYRMAEVRFIRALNYYYLLDLFFYSPMLETESSDFPHYVSRPQLYTWLVNELKDLTTKLKPTRASIYRVDRAAAYQLLARTYLNADVYNKYNKNWKEGSALTAAKEAADLAISCGYDLYNTKCVTDSGYVYTAYQQLFMADNHRPEVAKESPLIIYQDGVFCRNWGGAFFLTAATRLSGMTAWGSETSWNCFRTSPTMVYIFTDQAGFSHVEAKSLKYNEYEMPGVLKDDRAILCSYVDGKTPIAWDIKGERTKGSAENYQDCWAVVKFTNVSSKAQRPDMWKGNDKDWPDIDIPFMRIAEAYMIKAEAIFRQGNKGEALNIINNNIRKRANAEPLTTLTEVDLLNEWAREFYSEGRRRSDLVRFDRFYGPQSDQYRYNWEGRMNKNDGDQNFAAGTPEYLNWFPVPSDDKKVNPNFSEEVENDPNNPFASQGGDGYVYKK